MNEEHDPYTDLDDILSEFNKEVQEDKPVDSVFARPVESSEVAPDERDDWIQYQISIMGELFQGVDLTMGPRTIAPDFKSLFNRKKRNILNQPLVEDSHRKFLEMMTLETLAEAAEGQFDRLVMGAGDQVPNSNEHKSYQDGAGLWRRIADVVRAASEIKE